MCVYKNPCMNCEYLRLKRCIATRCQGRYKAASPRLASRVRPECEARASLVALGEGAEPDVQGALSDMGGCSVAPLLFLSCLILDQINATARND